MGADSIRLFISKTKKWSVLLTETVSTSLQPNTYKDAKKRGLKIDDTEIPKGYQLFHNYIRPHEALDGKTPAEACGITIEGNDKWRTLIENANKKA